MTLYLTERYLPGATPNQLRAIIQAEILSSERSTAAGKPVQYLGSIAIPGDGQMLCRFAAEDATHVRDVNEAADLPFTRIIEVIELGSRE